MNQDRDDLDIAELLSAVGQISPPSSGALGDAREQLWSAVADEMLVTDDPGTRTAEREADQPPQTARQRRPRGARRSGRSP